MRTPEDLLRELLAANSDPSGPEPVHTASGATLLIGELVVAKLHRPGTDGRALGARLRLAATTGGVALRPLLEAPIEVDGGRWATVWPRVDPVPPDPATAPWEQAGALLARLHRAGPVPGPDAPSHGATARLDRSLGRLRAVRSGAADAVRAAAERLPPAARQAGPAGRPRALVHGDWHLGQIGRAGLPGAPWVLFDLDDLGAGDPVWDLARPAGFRAAGLLPDDDWRAFLDGYRTAGGPALPAGDPWPALDPAARAAVVQAAAAGLSRAFEQRREPDDVDRELVSACARM